MKSKPLASALALTAFSVAFSAHAHDPKEHMKDAENPNCAAMKEMDLTEMDMTDPVMQAMMKQCIKDMHDGDSHPMMDNDASDEDHKKRSSENHTGHQH